MWKACLRVHGGISRHCLPLLILGTALFWSSSPVADHRIFVSNQGVAIYGFDPVAYFTEGRAVEGSKDISLELFDATWRFTSEQHRQLFQDDPGKYIPQYGGHCAWGIKTDGHIEPEPGSWRIVDDKLYLYRNHAAHSRWSKKQGFVFRADSKWEEQKAALLEP